MGSGNPRRRRLDSIEDELDALRLEREDRRRREELEAELARERVARGQAWRRRMGACFSLGAALGGICIVVETVARVFS
jgi:hypothetical protein